MHCLLWSLLTEALFPREGTELMGRAADHTAGRYRGSKDLNPSANDLLSVLPDLLSALLLTCVGCSPRPPLASLVPAAVCLSLESPLDKEKGEVAFDWLCHGMAASVEASPSISSPRIVV